MRSHRLCARFSLLCVCLLFRRSAHRSLRSEEEQAALPDGVDEDKYCLIRNHVRHGRFTRRITRLL